jgi:DNA-binding transcriptional LysR family regulator
VREGLIDAPQLANAQLLGDDLVELSRDSGISQVFDDAARDARTSRTVRAASVRFETICTLVAQGMGVSVVPLYLKAAKEDSLGLRFVPLADAWAKPRSFVAVRDDPARPVGIPPRAGRVQRNLTMRGETHDGSRLHIFGNTG